MLTRLKHFVFLAACLMISSQAAAGLIITEIMYDPSATPSGRLNEWIEIYYSPDGVTGTIDLSNYSLKNESFDPAASFNPFDFYLPGPSPLLMEPGDVAILLNSGIGPTAGLGLGGVDAIDEFNQSWPNSNGALLVLVDAWESLNSAVSTKSITIYNVNDPTISNTVESYTASDGNPLGFPIDTSSRSIYLNDIGADNGQGTNWSASSPGFDRAFTNVFNEVDVASPGFLPIPAITAAPEPSSFAIVFWIVMMGLVSPRRTRRVAGLD